MHTSTMAQDVTKFETTNYCAAKGLRDCTDGSCVSNLELCPEEEEVNRNTVLIMIIIGTGIIVAMILLYCYQQRSRRLEQQRAANSQSPLEAIIGDGDNLSLDNPPPNYDEVMGSNLYLPTTRHQTQHNGTPLSRLPSAEEPMTPPPNYDAALTILAQSHESFFPIRPEMRNSVVRRSVSSTEVPSPTTPVRSPSAAPQPFEFRRNTSVNGNS